MRMTIELVSNHSSSFLLLIIVQLIMVHCSTTVPRDIIKILENPDYDRHASPNQDKGHPTVVNVSMYIEGLSSFQASTMDFHVDIYFQETWMDNRLQHNHSQRVLIRDLILFEKMWHPDLYFANARKSSFHKVTAPNFLIWIHDDGRVHYDCRVSLTVICMMDLVRYPLDRQECDLRILSYAYDDEQLKVQWIEKDPIDKNRNIKLADMRLLNITSGTCPGEFPTGNWSCITANFTVQRQIMHHILQSYLPTALIVIISWFSFWLDVDSVPGRVSLCITTLLTLATQSSAARMALPQVSYLKAIDVWMGACLAFVFGVMIEFTLVNYWSRRKPPSERSILKRRQRTTAADVLKQWTSLAQETPLTDRRYFDSLRQPIVVRKRSTVASGNGVGSALNILADTSNADIEKAPTPAADGRCENQDAEWTALLPLHNCASEETAVSKDDGLSTTRKNSSYSVERLRLAYRQESRKTAQKIDLFCRIFFPVTFILFNIVYWTFYSRDWTTGEVLYDFSAISE